MHGFLSQRYKLTTGSAPIEATAPSAMACFRKFAGLAILALPSAIDADKALTCPSSSVYCGLEKDAAGTTQFVKHDLPEPGKCVNVASDLPEGGQFKLCGPGSWSLSRMSCDRHDHKKVEIVHPTNAYTADTCRVYSFSDYYQVDGYIGSAIFTCGATAR